MTHPAASAALSGFAAYAALGDTGKEKRARGRNSMIALPISLRTWHLAGARCCWRCRRLRRRRRRRLGRADDSGDRSPSPPAPLQRHRQADRAGAGLETGEPADRGREPSGRGGTHRRHSGRQGAAQRVHPAGALLLVQRRLFALQSLPYDTLNDFTAVLAALGKTPTVLGDLRRPRASKTAADLITAAKAKPGAMNFASAGIGSSIPPRRRSASPERPGSTPSTSRSARPNEALHRSDGRTDRFLFPPLAPRCRWSRKARARGFGREHRTRGPPPCPMCRPRWSSAWWIRPICSGPGFPCPRNSARDRRPHPRRNRSRPCSSRSCRSELAKVGSEPMPMSVDEFGKYFARTCSPPPS